MATANIVWIDGVAYATNHPKVKALNNKIDRVEKSGAGGPLIVPMAASVGNDSKPKTARTILSAEDKLNQTEKMLLVLLRARFGKDAVRIQAIRLELAPACCYTPDFSVWKKQSVSELLQSPRLVFFECKGKFIRDDSVVKLKTAARIYPEHDFWLCQWIDNRWIESIMPK